MALYQPTQRTDGKWDMTCSNSAGLFPIGYCGHAETGRDGGHETAEAAGACYRRYLLDKHLRLDGVEKDVQRKCIECGAFTQGRALLLADFPKEWVLCDEHRTRTFVEKFPS